MIMVEIGILEHFDSMFDSLFFIYILLLYFKCLNNEMLNIEFKIGTLEEN
jgi:hypothetical protein